MALRPRHPRRDETSGGLFGGWDSRVVCLSGVLPGTITDDVDPPYGSGPRGESGRRNSRGNRNWTKGVPHPRSDVVTAGRVGGPVTDGYGTHTSRRRRIWVAGSLTGRGESGREVLRLCGSGALVRVTSLSVCFSSSMCTASDAESPSDDW